MEIKEIKERFGIRIWTDILSQRISSISAGLLWSFGNLGGVS